MSWPSKLGLCQQVPLTIGLKSEFPSQKKKGVVASWHCARFRCRGLASWALCQQVPLTIGLKSEFPSQKIAGDSGVVA